MTDFEQLYKQYFKDVYRFVWSLCRDPAIAEEITQETFFKALHGIDQYKGTCKLNVWLCQIAKHTYFSYSAKQKRFVAHDSTEASSAYNLEAAMMDKEEALRIHKVLHGLEEPYKEVFTLRVFGELTFAQISRIFEKTESWSRVTFHRAKRKVQDRLKEV
ncbi:RNA polymerase sigma factor [Paenibacillus methanolicus]|uniref:RNA polymerase sigma-70 factor (ECF subfamily) n=1 Tax=Paenibacillus methanolicus TaxID=582686 RepID=A0A5S5C5P1_9BACL|nr:sigma-70 family RNA polymerase sigma factor [Paenibacillus methanolicus]TYP74644.1 RNA polymerase sigma-70 factor (ECF subfamily) [Paenibacillus methanolicus]